MPDVSVRTAEPDDANAIARVDALARDGSDRARRVIRAIETGECLVACCADRVAGYAVVNECFFGRPFLELIVVEEVSRRRGAGRALIRAVIDRFDGRTMFTSTNESNEAAQRLFEALGFVRSGVIDNLDPGDPELVYVWKPAG